MSRVIILVLLFLITAVPTGHAVWVWTPETNKFVNPKWAVKETPAEQLSYAMEFYEAGEYDVAVRELRKLLKHYPRAREAPQAQFQIGKILENQKKLYDAYKAYQLVIDKYPFSNLSEKIVKSQYQIALNMLDGEKDKGMILDSFVGTNYHIPEVLRSVIKNSPYGELAPVAQYKIGLYFLEQDLYQDARDEFMKVVNDYPESEWAQAAEYQIALSDSKRSAQAGYDQEITKAAVEQFEDFVKKNPEAEFSDKAKTEIMKLREKEAENNFLIAEFYEKQKKFNAAKMYYQSIVEDYRGTVWAQKALKKIQEMSLQK